MDIHPIIVHFPVALLTIYAVLELIRFKRVTNKPYWFNIKAIFAIFGFLAACAAYATGNDAGARSALGHMHQNFATLTLIIFAFLAAHYALLWVRTEGLSHRLPVLPEWLVIILALLGLAAITITGGLGGALVYGTHFDPFMAPIFKLLGVY